MILVDAGCLYALMDRRDRWHERVKEWWATGGAAHAVVPVTVLPQVCGLLAARGGADAEERFLAAVAAGEFAVVQLDDVDIARASDLMIAYRDLPLGFVDASIVAMAERLSSDTILTTDRKHFGTVRPRHVEALRLVP